MVPINSVSHLSGTVIKERDAEVRNVDQSTALYPIGRIADGIVRACQELEVTNV